MEREGREGGEGLEKWVRCADVQKHSENWSQFSELYVHTRVSMRGSDYSNTKYQVHSIILLCHSSTGPSIHSQVPLSQHGGQEACHRGVENCGQRLQIWL